MRPRAQRVVILIGALVAAALLLPSTLAHAFLERAPAQAAVLAPWDARVAAAAAADRVAHGADPRDATASRLITAALARDLTVIRAVELRAVALAAAGQEQRAAHLFELSSAASRRSLPTRLWLIQKAVDQGNVGGALANFDIALRTSSDAPPLLFPILLRAAGDSGLVTPIAAMLDRPSDWRLMFLLRGASQAPAAHDLANVVLHMRDRAPIMEGAIDQKLIERLVTGGDFAQAVRLRRHFGPPKQPLVADRTFADGQGRYPFGWGLAERADLRAERSIADGRTMLSYRASSSGGQLAAQLLAAPPGRYRLATRSAARTDGGTWVLTCATRRGVLGLLVQPVDEGGEASADVDIPGDCPAQWLTLQIGRADGPSAGAIAWVDLRRR